MIAADDRVTHADTDAPGLVTDVAELSGPFAGDQAGPWAFIHFDDGLACWCPVSALRVVPS